MFCQVSLARAEIIVRGMCLNRLKLPLKIKLLIFSNKTI